MTRGDALELARRFVRSMDVIDGEDEYVIVDAATREYDFGWLFFYESRKYLETRQIGFALAGNGPLFVSKTAERVEELSPVKPLEVHEEELKRRYGVL